MPRRHELRVGFTSSSFLAPVASFPWSTTALLWTIPSLAGSRLQLPLHPAAQLSQTCLLQEAAQLLLSPGQLQGQPRKQVLLSVCQRLPTSVCVVPVSSPTSVCVVPVPPTQATSHSVCAQLLSGHPSSGVNASMCSAVNYG